MAKLKKNIEKTPSGGDYSEIIFLNDKHEVVDETIATLCVIRECTNEGRLLKEIWGKPKKIDIKSEA